MSEVSADGIGSTDHDEEVHRRWGGTHAYKESHTRTAGYTREDFEAARREGDAAIQLLISAMGAGLPADSSGAIDAARAHQNAITRWYYECTDEIHVGLADMYLADERFTRYYEEYCPGLAQYVHDAIYAKSPGIRTQLEDPI